MERTHTGLLFKGIPLPEIVLLLAVQMATTLKRSLNFLTQAKLFLGFSSRTSLSQLLLPLLPTFIPLLFWVELPSPSISTHHSALPPANWGVNSGA